MIILILKLINLFPHCFSLSLIFHNSTAFLGSKNPPQNPGQDFSLVNHEKRTKNQKYSFRFTERKRKENFWWLYDELIINWEIYWENYQNEWVVFSTKRLLLINTALFNIFPSYFSFLKSSNVLTDCTLTWAKSTML